MRYNILQPIYQKHFDAMGNRVTDTQGNPAWLIQWKVIGQIASRATGENPLSAGFAEISNGKVTCFGRSESMCLGGLPDDSEALQLQLFGRLEQPK